MKILNFFKHYKSNISDFCQCYRFSNLTNHQNLTKPLKASIFFLCLILIFDCFDFVSIVSHLFPVHSYLLTGAVASMFWVDAELGSDIYLDGKIFVTCDLLASMHLN